jgi:hypothetical protein|tara:strand:+ start:162 stop:374 length:213 start_codon:yes stop_codon:yes gene_type:complete
MEKIELLKKIIEDQSVLINKLHGYLTDTIETPKIVVNTSRQIKGAEAKAYLKKYLDNILRRNLQKKKHLN